MDKDNCSTCGKPVEYIDRFPAHKGNGISCFDCYRAVEEKRPLTQAGFNQMQQAFTGKQ